MTTHQDSDHPQQTAPIRYIRNTHTPSDQRCCGCSGCSASQKGAQPGNEHDNPPRLAYSVEEAATMLAVGRDSIYELIRTGQLATFKIGARRLVALHDLQSFIATAKAAS